MENFRARLSVMPQIRYLLIRTNSAVSLMLGELSFVPRVAVLERAGRALVVPEMLECHTKRDLASPEHRTRRRPLPPVMS